MSVPSRNVAFKKPEEPKFLKAFKAKVGYREPASVDTKREVPPGPPEREGSEDEREDEQPTVVVLREGDVTEEEYDAFKTAIKNDDPKLNDSAQLVTGPSSEDTTTSSDAQLVTGPSSEDTTTSSDAQLVTGPSSEDTTTSSDGRIKFRKPVKRRSSEGSGVLDATTKKPKTEDRKRRRTSSTGSNKGVKNSSLLSFEDDDDDST